MITAIIIFGYFIGWLWAARRNWRSWRIGGDNELVNQHDEPSSPAVTIAYAMILAIGWPLLLPIIAVTTRQPLTATELERRTDDAKKLVDAKNRDLQEAEAALHQATELMMRVQGNSTVPDAVKPWVGTPHELTALELFDRHGLVTVTDGRGRTVHVTSDRYQQHPNWTSAEWLAHSQHQDGF